MKSTIEIQFPEDTTDRKGFLPTLKGVERVVRNVNKQTLAASLAELAEDVSDIIMLARKKSSLGVLESVSVAAEVSAEGGFSFVGQFVAGTAGTVTLTFRVVDNQ